MKEDRLIITKSPEKSGQGKVIQISPATHAMIKQIAVESGLSMYDVTNRMIEFAFNRVEIID